MNNREVLFVVDAADNKFMCSATDLRTNVNYMVYKSQGVAQKGSLCFLNDEYVIAANSTKPILPIWPINSQEQVLKPGFVVPGRVSALAVSPCNTFLIAGIQETVYVWQLKTGSLLNKVCKHFQAVTCLRFTSDGSLFVSVSSDGGVLVWSLMRVVGQADNSSVPLHSFHDHSLEVTDVHIGTGGLYSYLYTVSLDHSCKIYDIFKGTLLLSVVFEERLRSIAVDLLEMTMYIGTDRGSIIEYKVDKAPRVKEYHIEKQQYKKLSGHKSGTAVNCLRLSMDGMTLVSGGDDCNLCIWNLQSRQLVSTIVQKGAVTSVEIRLLSPKIFQSENKPPRMFAQKLRSMIKTDLDADEEEAIEVLVTEDIEMRAELIQQSIEHVQGPTPQICDSTVSASNFEQKQLHDEIRKLKSDNAALKRQNQSIEQTFMKYLLNTKQNSSNSCM